VDTIIAKYGSVTFGVSYNIWVIATSDEYILLQGGGLDECDLFLMKPNRSELGGVTASLAILGTLSRYGLINTASSAFVSDNESAVLSTKRPFTDIISHHMEGDLDLVSTIRDLQENWCRGIEITYKWVKGHTHDLNRELNREERLHGI
jgi:hypothetical protein